MLSSNSSASGSEERAGNNDSLSRDQVKRLSYLLLSVASIYTRFSTFPVHGISTKDEKANYAAGRTFEEDIYVQSLICSNIAGVPMTVGVYSAIFHRYLLQK